MSIIGLFPTALGVYKINRQFNLNEMQFVLDSYRTKVFTGTNSISSNTYVLNSMEMLDIKKFIDDSISKYLSEVDPLPSTSNLYITQSWLTFTETEEYHHIHNHPNSYLSGVLYIKQQSSNNKIFFRHPKQRDILIEKTIYTPFNSEEYSINSEEGTLLLFPSYIEHYVEKYKGSSPRISLAFNTFIKGQLGSTHSLTKLDL